MTASILATAAASHEISVPALVVGLVLLLANGFFVAAEISLLAARQVRIEERAEQGDPRAKLAVAALDEISITFSGAQLGITMASIGLGAVAEPAVAAVFERLLEQAPLSEGAITGISFALGLSLVVFLHMVIGEMAPKNLALARAEDTALRLVRVFRIFIIVLRPLIVLLNGLANVLVRAVGVTPTDSHSLGLTPRELSLALRESQREGTLRAQDARVLGAALRLNEIDAESAMTPRPDLVTVADNAPAESILELAATTGFTRFPVHHGDPDDVVGLVHVKDALIRGPGQLDGLTVADLIRPITAVPETRMLDHLLGDMRADRSHAVLVVDEYGATAGMVTLEDVLEELVGEIEDEFDPRAAARRRRGDSWIVDGLLRGDEVERLTGLRLPEGETETLSGFFVEHLGRFAERGDVIDHEGWTMRVLTVKGRRAGRVELTPPPEPEEASEVVTP